MTETHDLHDALPLLSEKREVKPDNDDPQILRTRSEVCVPANSPVRHGSRQPGTTYDDHVKQAARCCAPGSSMAATLLDMPRSLTRILVMAQLAERARAFSTQHRSMQTTPVLTIQDALPTIMAAYN